MRLLALFGAVGIGFLLGFLWGTGTRSQLSDATETDFSGGVFTLRIRALDALKGGLTAFFR